DVRDPVMADDHAAYVDSLFAPAPADRAPAREADAPREPAAESYVDQLFGTTPPPPPSATASVGTDLAVRGATGALTPTPPAPPHAETGMDQWRGRWAVDPLIDAVTGRLHRDPDIAELPDVFIPGAG